VFLIEVKLVIPHLPTVPTADIGRLEFSFSFNKESIGTTNVG
jgi:hypothetical protein